MLLVLDANEYIYALGVARKPACTVLLDTLLSAYPTYSLRIPRLVTNEVRRHLNPKEFREFIKMIQSLTDIDEDFVVPFELGTRYESEGLKSADAFIAAYVEWTGAEMLISENRHFLRRSGLTPFKILNAANFLKSIKDK